MNTLAPVGRLANPSPMAACPVGRREVGRGDPEADAAAVAGIRNTRWSMGLWLSYPLAALRPSRMSSTTFSMRGI